MARPLLTWVLVTSIQLALKESNFAKSILNTPNRWGGVSTICLLVVPWGVKGHPCGT